MKMYHRCYNNNGSDYGLTNNDDADGDHDEDELVISIRKWYYIYLANLL